MKLRSSETSSNICGFTYLAFLPIGLTLIIPLRNSTKVPLEKRVSTKSRKIFGLEMTLPFDRDVHVCDIMKNEIHEWLVLLLADPFDERLRLKLFSELVSNKAVLGEGVVKIVDDCINLAPKIRIH